PRSRSSSARTTARASGSFPTTFSTPTIGRTPAGGRSNTRCGPSRPAPIVWSSTRGRLEAMPKSPSTWGSRPRLLRSPTVKRSASTQRSTGKSRLAALNDHLARHLTALLERPLGFLLEQGVRALHQKAAEQAHVLRRQLFQHAAHSLNVVRVRVRVRPGAVKLRAQLFERGIFRIEHAERFDGLLRFAAARPGFGRNGREHRPRPRLLVAFQIDTGDECLRL